MKLFALLFALVLSHASLFAQSFTLEQILKSPFPTELTVSHQGNRIAWVLNQQGSRNIFIKENNNAARQLTNYSGDNGQDINSLSFTADGNTLVYIRGGAPNTGGDLPNPAQRQETIERAIYKIKVDGGNPDKIGTGYYPKVSPKGDAVAYLSTGQVWYAKLDSMKPRKLFQSRGSQNSLRWSPDGEKIAFVSTRNDHSFVGVYELKNKTLTFLNPGTYVDTNPVWSPNGDQVAFVRQYNERDGLIFEPHRESLPWSIVVANISTGKVQKIWEAKSGKGSSLFEGALIADNILFWTSDGFLIFPYEGDGWNHLYAVPAKGGEARLLTPGDGEVEYASISADKKNILYNSNITDTDRRHIWQVSATGSPVQLTSGKTIEWAPSLSADGTLFCLQSNAITPAHAVRFKSNKFESLAPDVMPSDFPSAQLVEPQAVMITATDGMRIPVQLFLPKNHKPGDKHPAAIFFHGGSRRQMLLGFNYSDYYHKSYAMNQYLANQGYVVLSVNYRSGIGYGMEFREALNYGATGASEFNDVMGAGLYLKNRVDVDGSKIVLWGGSYGGYLTALGLSRASDLFACGVDIHGCHDWNVVVKNFIPAYDVHKRAEWAKKAFESSPMNFIKGWKSPVLIIHGDDDRNVPFSESVTLAEQLKKLNVYHEQLVFPDEVHGFLLHKNWISAYTASADFFARILKR
jgi:dipeptidyl aminopeptidase/acylaminoacyl peptidase